MSENVINEIPVITDPAAVIGELQQMWRWAPPKQYSGESMRRFADTEHDQKTVGENPYWDIVRWLPVDRLASYETAVDGYAAKFGHDYVVSRDRLTRTYAWSIPSPGDIAWIKSQLDGRGVVEIGAGTGYWAWQLSQAGVDVVAYDDAPNGNHWCGEVQYHPVCHGGPEQAAEHAARALMLCWPPYGAAMAEQALRAYTGDTLIYIGEGEWGCTADDGFFKELESSWERVGESPAHVTFGGIHCHVEIYRRVEGGAAS